MREKIKVVIKKKKPTKKIKKKKKKRNKIKNETAISNKFKLVRGWIKISVERIFENARLVKAGKENKE